MPFGTLQVSDLVRNSFQNILEYGEGQLADYIMRLNAAHNEQTRNMLGYLAQPTTERILGYGGSSGVQWVKTGEHGRADASKPTFGTNMGLPLEYQQASVQWTRKWFENHTAEELEAVYNDVKLTDTQQVQKDIKNAIFPSTNRTVTDELVDNYSLSVKALANNDGFSYPPGPNGEAFATSHNHYVARVSTLAASDIDAAVLNVAEHFNRGKVLMLINSSNEAAVRLLSGFNIILPAVLMPQTDENMAAGNLDTSDIYNRMIGYWGTNAAEIWVKPWIPANYMLFMIAGAGTKVLGMRERRPGSGDLKLEVDNETFPLRAKTWSREVGFGVIDRLAASVLYVGGTSYVDPTF